MTHRSTAIRRIIVLGSTGSIGVNTLAVIDHLNQLAQRDDQTPRFEVVGLAAGSNADKLIEQASAFKSPAVAIADAQSAKQVQSALPKMKVYAGPDAALQLMQQTQATDTVAAMVGAAGLPAIIEAIGQGHRIALANKETLVAAGALVAPLVRQHGATLIPVDSEHSAIFQCLCNHPADAVKRIVLTASGGPFRQASKHTIENATLEEALNHPTWSMGPKITIDSATMMNKALEIIEAHWLFNLPAEKIDVIVHPQSIVHSFVEFEDHSVLAQLGPPDMRTPIQYALTWPSRPTGCSEAMDWSKLSTLAFEPADFERFSALKLAYEAIEAGGAAPAVLNAANETAVAAFLERRIRFGQIVDLAAETLAAIPPRPLDSLETVYEADRQAREFVTQRLDAAVETQT